MVPRNRFYGLRIPATCASDSVWDDAHALSGRHLCVLGAVMVALEFMLPASIRALTLRMIAISGLLGITTFDWRTANRWGREREVPHDS